MDEWHAATREEAMRRLADFVPRAGSAYARDRNFDRGPDDRRNVSTLSPYLRHRLIGEEEVVRAVLSKHRISGAQKFVEEICWRTYWKGWLEQRPSIWWDYLSELQNDRANLAGDEALRRRYRDAISGETGIAAFDAWSRQLLAHGYLHNHARMWFASIWIFTLRLPWTLGADFFYRHLLDGDPASNTLSWRWVAGLQTRGKHYIARAENIRQYTEGRFDPAGELNEAPDPLEGPEAPPPVRLRPPMSMPANEPVVLLLGEDDLSPERWPIDTSAVKGVAALPADTSYSGLAEAVIAFRSAAIDDGLARAGRSFGCPVTLLAPGGADDLVDFCRAQGVETIVTPQVPIGPSRETLETRVAALSGSGLAVIGIRRDWDSAFWPYARHGFFKLKERIPETLERLGFL